MDILGITDAGTPEEIGLYIGDDCKTTALKIQGLRRDLRNGEFDSKPESTDKPTHVAVTTALPIEEQENKAGDASHMMADQRNVTRPVAQAR